MTMLNEDMSLLSHQEDSLLKRGEAAAADEEEVRMRRGQPFINNTFNTITSQYLPNEKIYKTVLLNSCDLSNQQQHDLTTTPKACSAHDNNNITSGITITTRNNHLEQRQQVESRKENQTKSNSNIGGRSIWRESCFANSLIHFYNANCLLSCLLGAALFASVANTFLLSLVVKSIQLNDVSSNKRKPPKQKGVILFPRSYSASIIIPIFVVVVHFFPRNTNQKLEVLY